MSLNNSVSVRFDPTTKSKLAQVSGATGFKESDLIRRAVTKLLDEIDETGSISFPVQFVSEPEPAYRSDKKGKS